MELTTLSAEDWREAMLSEDTEAFLSAVRNYLGPIPTPYNKHVLVAKLEAFLKKPGTAEAQASLLDSFDAQILGALALAGPSTERFLRELLADGRSSWDVSAHLSNLRDRLVLFRASKSRGSVLAVTPMLAERLGREAGPRALLGCVPADGPEPLPVVDAETACAAACALFHEDNPLRRDGSLSKRCRERILALVPELSEETGGGDPLGALAAGFQGAGLLSFRGDGRGALDPVRLAAAADAWKDRLPFFLAAASATLGFQPRGDPGPTEPASALADRARLLETLAACLPGGSAVSEEGLRRAALLAGRFLGMSGASQADYAVEALRRFGLVRSGARGFVRAAPRRRPGGRPEGKRTAPVLVVEASHAVQVLPEADPSERAFAGVVARLEARGEVWSCVLDRRSARRALDAGFGADYMARTFEELSGRPLPQSLAFSLAGWEKEYLSVRLYSGILLAADGPARTLAENAPALKRLLGERVSEGVWLLSSEDPAEARSALESAGLHAPRLRRAGEMYSERKDLPGAPPGAGSPPWAAALAAGGPERERRPQEALDRLRRALDSAGLPEERRVELAERISRRLVLTEDQLSRAETGGPRLEAGALDYLGKVRVVERVLRRPGALLELLFRKQDGEPERIRVRPLELEKTDKGLVLRAADPGDGSVRVLAVSSLSHVRWIKTTLFGEDNECDDK